MQGTPLFISVIIPIYNEEENIPELHARLTPVLEKLCVDSGQPRDSYEIIMVDEGSRDRSWSLIRDVHGNDRRVKGVTFARDHHEAPVDAQHVPVDCLCHGLSRFQEPQEQEQSRRAQGGIGDLHLAAQCQCIAGDEDDESTIDEKEVLRSETGLDKEEPSNTAGTTEEDGLQSKETTEQRKPGRQSGSQGFGRTQQLAVTDTTHHSCGCCSACNEDLTSDEKAYTGFHTVNIEFGNSDSPGVQLTNILHLYYMGEVQV